MATTQHLSKRALADLARSGITPTVARRLGIAPVANAFGAAADDYRIPYFDLDGNLIDFARDKNFDRSDRKYSQLAGTLPHLYFPPLLRPTWRKVAEDARTRLYVTEGEKKAAALCLCSLAAIGIGGVSCWRGRGARLPEWDEIAMEGREVGLVFDSDIVDKPEVRRQEAALAAELVAMGAVVVRVRLPQTV